MTTLIDVLPVKSRKATAFVGKMLELVKQPGFEEALKRLTVLNAFPLLWESLGRDTNKRDYTRAFEDLNRERMKVFAELGEIPSALRLDIEHHKVPFTACGFAFEDVIYEMSERPRCALRDLRRAADALGYILLPAPLLDPATYAKESTEMRKRIEAFAKTGARYFDIYVLCPPEAYHPRAHAWSVGEEHILNKGDSNHRLASYRIYGRGAEAELLSTLVMLVEGMVKRSITIERRYSTSDEMELKKADPGFCPYIVQAYGGLLRARGHDNAHEAASEVAWKICGSMITDLIEKHQPKPAPNSVEPVMFALPKDTDLHAEFDAPIGPCWGPDLGKELVALMTPLFEASR